MHPPINVYDRDVTVHELQEAAKVIETFITREIFPRNKLLVERRTADKVTVTALDLRAHATRKRLDEADKKAKEEKELQFFQAWARAWQEFLEEEETKKTMLTMGLDDIVRIMSAHYDAFYATYYAEGGTNGKG